MPEKRGKNHRNHLHSEKSPKAKKEKPSHTCSILCREIPANQMCGTPAQVRRDCSVRKTAATRGLVLTASTKIPTGSIGAAIPVRVRPTAPRCTLFLSTPE